MKNDRPHRRWNPLREEWVLNSPNRSGRPWRGAVERTVSEQLPSYEPTCYLCPGNERAAGARNPRYPDVFAFTNDFAALTPDLDQHHEVYEPIRGIVRAVAEEGVCRVLCFSPRHDLTLAEMEPQQIACIIRLWRDELDRLKSLGTIRHVMTFENKGEQMGCSNPHPHGQIWASSSVPGAPAREIESQERHFRAHNEVLMLEYLKWELGERERIVVENESWIALVPYWATWPFETIIVPRRQVSSVTDLSDDEIAAWSSCMKELLVRYDNLFECSFPYSMGVYQAPLGVSSPDGFQLRQIFLPPLLRSASIKKFMVGYELCAEPQRDISPELAANRLRQVGSRHYRASTARSQSRSPHGDGSHGTHP